ncbi:hypothetical protein M5K25_006899 [Dendrobium thyrsiflorum]|uniref:Uncharacterized protein n=1 Tax=Dendrobium thyrsiflorum TaxID=117978 RepID=A0ABD0VJI8_DENTH
MRSSTLPKWASKPCIMGIDEAGRGPVLGFHLIDHNIIIIIISLIIAICNVEHEAEFEVPITKSRSKAHDQTKGTFLTSQIFCNIVQYDMRIVQYDMRIVQYDMRIVLYDIASSSTKVIIDKEDLGTFLHLRTEGDRLHTLIQEADISWSLVNDTLRGNKDKIHQPRVYTLLQNARIIQHVLRSSIISKAGDRVNITLLLSLVTHLIMSNNPFDEAQLILDYIHSLSDIRHPQTKTKKNIVLGHLVCYIIEKKYNLIYPEPPTEEPIFFTNASFRSLVHDPTVEVEDSEGEKEAPPEPAPVPNQNAFQDMIQRFDTMKINFGQRFDQIDLHMKTQEDRHNLDMAWIRGQTDYINQNVVMINSYFTAFNPQPPPDQDPGA